MEKLSGTVGSVRGYLGWSDVHACVNVRPDEGEDIVAVVAGVVDVVDNVYVVADGVTVDSLCCEALIVLAQS